MSLVRATSDSGSVCTSAARRSQCRRLMSLRRYSPPIFIARLALLILTRWYGTYILRGKRYPEGPYLPTLVAKGVTGVRNMGAPPELIAQRRREIAEGKLVGPRIITRDRTGRLGVEHCRITRASRPSTGGG